MKVELRPREAVHHCRYKTARKFWIGSVHYRLIKCRYKCGATPKLAEISAYFYGDRR